EAIHMSARTLDANISLEAVDLAEHGALLQFDSGFGKIGFRLAKVGHTLFGIGTILGAFLFDLVPKVVKFGLRIAGEIDLLGAIKDRDEVAFLDFGSIGNEFGERHRSALAEDLGDEDFGGADGFDGAGDADFALGTRRVWRGSMSHGRGSRGAGGKEDERDRG